MPKILKNKKFLGLIFVVVFAILVIPNTGFTADKEYYKKALDPASEGCQGSNWTCESQNKVCAVINPGDPAANGTKYGCVDKDQIRGLEEEEDPGFFLSAILYAISWLAYYIWKFLSLLLGFVQGWAVFFLTWSEFTQAKIVQTGWSISRDVVNGFFAFVFLIIAFSTILRVKDYGAKALLPKLIGVALLINFSLFFAGTIIDFSNVLTRTFVEQGIEGEVGSVDLKTVDGNKKVSEKIADSLQVNSIGEKGGNSTTQGTNPTEMGFDKYKEKTSEKGLTLSDVFAGILFNIVFTMVALFVFLAMAALFFIRVIALWFLLIVLPVALFLSILPATKGPWNSWLKQFFKWVFFAPAMAFFVFLALRIHSIYNNNNPLAGVIPSEVKRIGIGQNMNVFELLIVLGLLVGGLIVAQSMGIAAAGTAIKLGKSAAHGTRRWIGAKSLKAGYSERLKKGKEGDGTLTKLAKFALRGTAKGIGYGARPEVGIAGLKSRFKTSDSKAIEKAAAAMAGTADKQYQIDVRKKQSELNKKGPNYAAQNISKSIGKDAVALDASTRVAMLGGRYEETFRQYMKNEKVAAAVRKKLGLKKGAPVDYSAQNLGLAIEEGYKRAGLKKEYITASLHDIKSGVAAKGQKQFNSWTAVNNGKIVRSGYARSGNKYLGYTEDGKEIQYTEKELKEAQDALKENGGKKSDITEQNEILEIHTKIEADIKKKSQTETGAKKTSNLDPSAIAAKRGGTEGEEYLTHEGAAIFKNLTMSDVNAINKGKVRTDTAETALRLQDQILEQIEDTSQKNIVKEALEGFERKLDRSISKEAEVDGDGLTKGDVRKIAKKEAGNPSDSNNEKS